MFPYVSVCPRGQGVSTGEKGLPTRGVCLLGGLPHADAR